MKTHLLRALPALPILVTLAAAACAPAPAVTPTPVPTATASGATAAPTPAGASPTAAPSTAASASPVPSFTLANGALLRKYDFKGIGGLYYDFFSDELHVIDGVNENTTPRRYLLRKFARSGTFLSAIALNLPGEAAPEAVDGYAFDRGGNPAFTYLDDERFVLRRLLTATVQDATRLPNSNLERAGIASLGADNNVFTLGVMRYDPDRTDTQVREIQYMRAEEEKGTEALFRIPDPFQPTARMAMGAGGKLYLFGPNRDGSQGVKVLDQTQALADVPMALSRVPDKVWIDPDGDLWLTENSTGSTPAKLRRYAATGELRGETEVVLANGDKVFEIAGIAQDAQGKLIVAGRAIAANLGTTLGLFTFDR